MEFNSNNQAKKSMVSRISQHLKEMAEQDSRAQILVAQWEFDSRLVSTALQNVGKVFGHYSRHDSSHSDQIITNIERILGPKVAELSATDAWLLLEAAYWHDIGMIVSNTEIVEAIKSGEIEGIDDTEVHSTKDLGARENQKESTLSRALRTVQDYEELRLTIADHYRASHPSRSRSFVSDPMDTIGVASPRHTLLPKRLFRYLGEICAAHGDQFENTLMLPFEEAGLGVDNCHPRFISCLLRVGDLLDMDDNRFCPTMMKSNGPLPVLSEAHFGKHAAMRRFRLSPKRIEATAVCSSYDAYVECNNWFSWVKQELSDQSSRWADIVPENSTFVLPTAGDMNVTLEGPQKILPGGTVPKFSVSDRSVFDIVKGAGIYSSKFQSVRELLQNAVDSETSKAWVEFTTQRSKEEIERVSSYETEEAEALRKSLASRSVQVEISPLEKGDASSTEWDVRIRDHGVGLALEEVAYLLEVGSSNDNRIKASRLKNIPSWFAPSGSFGIGFHSVFQLSDRVKIRTSPLDQNSGYEIDLTSPGSELQGYAFVKGDTDELPIRDGLELTFRVHFDPEEGFSISNEDAVSSRTLHEYDPVLEDFPSLGAAKLVDAIVEFAKYAPCQIELTFNGQSVPTKSIKAANGWFDEETGLLVRQCIFSSFRGSGLLLYRGQALSEFRSNFSDAGFEIDILRHKASKILTIDRNNVRGSERSRLRKDIIDTLIRFAKEKDLCGKPEKENSQYCSLFLNNYDKSVKALKLDLGSLDPHCAWRNASFLETGESVNELLSKDQLELFFPNQFKDEDRAAVYKNCTDVATHSPFIVSPNDRNSTLEEMFLLSWLRKSGSVCVVQNSPPLGDSLSLEMSVEDPLTNEHLSKLLCVYINNRKKDRFSGNACSRVAMPVFPEFEALAVKTSEWPWLSRLYGTHRLTEKMVVLPFDFKNDEVHLREEVPFAEKIRASITKSLSLEEVIRLNENLAKFIEKIMIDCPEWSVQR